ncbi:MAG: hypothetical protein K9G58_04130 [Bacteroidales bacterium]|nr:hypothetical protein [Bacteroidales bacterium]MCF8388549.1 hypothetical protein [Bacteroidales bacterium]MCF8397332.1 hypothetical protein [Bacteroidales bacterium]
MEKLKNILLVAGAGRNVGKTSIVTSLVRQFRGHGIIAIKISPHFHELKQNERFIVQSEKYNILEEQDPGTSKDSSRFLDAGAEKVFFIQSRDEDLGDAFGFLRPMIANNKPVLVESGGLRNFIIPGVFLFVSGPNRVNRNEHLKEIADKVVGLQAGKPDFNPDIIAWNHSEWKLEIR